MAEPNVVSGHQDLQNRPVVPPEGGKERQPFPEGSYPRYSKKNEKTGKFTYPGSAPTTRRFFSHIDKLRIQLISEPPIPTVGGWQPGITKYLKFDGSVYTTSNVDDIIAIENCGRYGRDICDLDAKAAADKEAGYQDALEMVRKDPELAKRLKVDINKKDFFEETIVEEE